MLRKPTKILRETVSQELRVVLGPEEGAPVRAVRRVQLLIPEAPQMVAALDVLPEAFGLNRVYKLPVMSPGAQIQFRLTAEQFVVAASHQGIAELTVIVEYVTGDDK